MTNTTNTTNAANTPSTTINGVIIELIKGDITDLALDAIVNAANSHLVLGLGVAGAIAFRGGPTIQEECDEIGHCDVGQAVITSGGRLPAKHVIHAVGPMMGEGSEREKLAGATRSSLEVAASHDLTSIAFPAISTGVFGYPLDDCAAVMLSTVIDFAVRSATSVKRIVLCLYDERAYRIFADTFQRLLDQRAGPGTAQ